MNEDGGKTQVRFTTVFVKCRASPPVHWLPNNTRVEYKLTKSHCLRVSTRSQTRRESNRLRETNEYFTVSTKSTRMSFIRSQDEDQLCKLQYRFDQNQLIIREISYNLVT